MIYGCLEHIKGEPEEVRCAYPMGHLGPHGGAFNKALERHDYVMGAFGWENDTVRTCDICHCAPDHEIHQPSVVVDYELPEYDPIERYLKLLTPDHEQILSHEPVPVMAIATGLLLCAQELRRITRELEKIADNVAYPKRSRE